MADLMIDIAGRFKSAYGIVPVFVTQNSKIPGSEYMPIVSGVNLYDDSESSFEDTDIEGGGFSLKFAGGKLTKSGRTGNVFAPPLMCRFRKTKQLIETILDGDGGIIVERYGDGPWEVEVQGLLVDMEHHKFPLYKIEQIRKLFEVPDSLNVIGDMWEVNGIKTVYFYDFVWSGVQGYQDTIQFSVMARSLKPVEFYLNGEEEEA
ncbi:hypothetical protein CAP35_13750 [Chitinophagaceae bacterium IBVUCB1]|nr:hypothetical protein CAP35_13750 [Chitinophagaceae bacterium IBVUCB1]